MAGISPLVLGQLGLGLLLLVVGGDGFVRGAVAIARRAGLSPLLIGLTLVGFGTSTPELLTSVQAALAGSPGIAVGNVVGSNIANILLILGVAAILHPLHTSARAFARDGTVVLLAAIACVGLAFWGELGRGPGLVLVAALVAYLVYTYRSRARGAGRFGGDACGRGRRRTDPRAAVARPVDHDRRPRCDNHRCPSARRQRHRAGARV